MCLARGRSFSRLFDGSDVGARWSGGVSSGNFLLAVLGADVGGVWGKKVVGRLGSLQGGFPAKLVYPKLILRFRGRMGLPMGVAIGEDSANEFHMDGAALSCLFPAVSNALSTGFSRTGEYAPAANNAGSWLSRMLLSSCVGTLCRRKGEEVRGARGAGSDRGAAAAEEIDGGGRVDVVRVRLSLVLDDEKMLGWAESVIPGAIACPCRLE